MINSKLFFVRCFFAIVVIQFLATNINAQGVGVNSSGNTADPSAILDASSNTQGVLIPRMSTTERNAISTPAEGLQIINTTTKCLEIYLNNLWQSIYCACSIPAAPTAGINTATQSAVTWNWNVVNGATGYKYSTSDNYANTTDNGASTSYTQTGLACNTAYTLYVWAYNACGSSSSRALTQTTSVCCTGSMSFSYLTSMQTWVIPDCVTQITITANGSSGGANPSGSNGAGGAGGLGAQIISPPVAVTGGHTLNIITGGAGSTAFYGGGGGGGTYVWDATSNTLLVVAGGGGGAGDGANHSDNAGGAGQINTASLNSPTNAPAGGNLAGGNGGNGGSGGAAYWASSGGAGWLSNGGNGFGSGQGGGTVTGGASPANGAAGGSGGASYPAPGGYGGGGGGDVCGGGGGGYNGGGGSQTGSPIAPPGGGGGSYCITGTPTTSTNSGNGSVTIVW